MSLARLDRLARTRRAVDRDHAEPVRAEPRAEASPYAESAPDPARPAFDLVGPLAIGTGDEGDLGAGASRNWASRIPLGQAEFHVDPTTYPLALSLRKGDQLVATERGDARFEIARIDQRQLARLVFRLTVQ